MGKTTLCKMLMGELEPDAGTHHLGPRGQRRLPGAGPPRGHPQRHHRRGVAPLLRPHGNSEDIRGLLRRMLFKGEEG